jgi:hypothetical protein
MQILYMKPPLAGLHIQYLLECRRRETHSPVCSRPLSSLSYSLFLSIVRYCLPFSMVSCRHYYICCSNVTVFFPPLPPSYGKPSFHFSRHSLREIPHLYHEMAYWLSSFMTVKSAICVTLSDILSDIASDILLEKPAPCAKIGLLETTLAWNGGMMAKLSETELKMLVRGGETNTVELKLAAPRAIDLAERFCGMANARGGIVFIVLFLEQYTWRFHSSTKVKQGQSDNLSVEKSPLKCSRRRNQGAG